MVGETGGDPLRVGEEGREGGDTVLLIVKIVLESRRGGGETVFESRRGGGEIVFESRRGGGETVGLLESLLPNSLRGGGGGDATPNFTESFLAFGTEGDNTTPEFLRERDVPPPCCESSSSVSSER